MNSGENDDKLQNAQNIPPEETYIDPKSDFGFSYFFCKEHNKDLLIDLINKLLNGKRVVKDLVYGRTDHKGSRKKDRKPIFDLYCTDIEGRHLIIEMQVAKQIFFKDRSIFYTSSIVLEQGRSVARDWNYELPEIYFIGLMDFCFDDSHPDQYIHNVHLVDVNTNTIFYKKLNYIFVELPKFNKANGELKTALDGWLDFFKNPNNVKRIPLSLNKRIFTKLVKIAAISGLNEKDMNAYERELKIHRDIYSANEYLINQGKIEGKVEGKLEGKNEGKLEEKLGIALKMKKDGASIEKIIKYTELSLEEVSEL